MISSISDQICGNNLAGLVTDCVLVCGRTEALPPCPHHISQFPVTRAGMDSAMAGVKVSHRPELVTIFIIEFNIKNTTLHA